MRLWGFLLSGMSLLSASCQAQPQLQQQPRQQAPSQAPSPAQPSTSYTWSHAAWSGGYITGMAFHPTARNVIYARTDMGTLYKWNAKASKWDSLMDWVPRDQDNLLGPESVAVSAADKSGNTMLVALGRYAADWSKPSKGRLAKSSDGGVTWKLVGPPLSIAANWDQPYGERLAIDPTNGNNAFYASRGEGLWASRDGGEAWSQVKSAPGDTSKPTERSATGLAFCLFAPKGTMYLGVIGQGIARSTDGGSQWQMLEGSPKQPYRASVSGDGVLFVSHDDGVSRWDEDAWRDVTPQGEAGNRFVAVGVDPRDSKRVLVGQLQEWKHGRPMFQSKDGGESWRAVGVEGAEFDFGPVKYLPKLGYYRAAAPAQFQFDPFDAKSAWFCDWNGVWKTSNVDAERPTWLFLPRGHEQGAVITLKSTTIAPLLSGVADSDGFRHTKLDEYAPSNHAGVGTQYTNETTGLDFSEADPNFAVRIAAYGWERKEGGVGAYSTNNGASWTPFPKQPEGAWGGRIAVAHRGAKANDGEAILWVNAVGGDTANKNPWFSHDRGQTWTQSKGAPEGAFWSNNIWNWSHPVASDRVTPNTFYLYNDARLFRSSDGGANFAPTPATLPRANGHLFARPGKAGELWLALGEQGLHRSTNGGDAFAKIANVERADLFACSPGFTFVLGRVNGQDGLFRSEDNGSSWKRIGGDEPAFATANSMEADRVTPARVFIGTNGRGIWVGTAQPATRAATRTASAKVR